MAHGRSERTVGLTGASGHLGRRVVEMLLESGRGRIVALTRRPHRLADLAHRGVIIRRADFDQPEALPTAFAGIERLLIISTDAVDRPGRRLRQHHAAVEGALRAGVEHLLYTSLTNPGPNSPVSIAPDHWATEQAIIASRRHYTILRNDIYTDLFLSTLPRAVVTGQLLAAAGDGGAGYVTREDCARTAAAALAADTAGQNILDVTGPAVVSHAELARLATEVTGRRVTYVPVDPGNLRRGLLTAGVPPAVVDSLVSFDVAIARGIFAVVTSVVRDLTGTPPESVAQFLYRHREPFAPPPGQRREYRAGLLPN